MSVISDIEWLEDDFFTIDGTNRKHTDQKLFKFKINAFHYNLFYSNFSVGRLIRSRNAVSFDVKTTYDDSIGRENTDFGHAFSFGPRYAMMELKNDEFQDNNMDMQCK